jgi:tRNA pseudouridine38-40 synthase
LEQRYFIELAFKGTAYNGWQVQPNGMGVQQVIEETLAILIKEKVRITGAGRTDTGVHASYFVAHFNSGSEFLHQPGEIVRKLNHMLPDDIAIYSIFPVSPGDHSRFSAISRTYKYFIALHKNPFKKEISYQMNIIPDTDAMNKAAAELLKYDDFGSFCRTGTNVTNHICRVRMAQWEQGDEMLIFTIQANRFLRNMVRAIVGTLIAAGLGKITVEGFREIIEAKDRGRARTSAPAQGLFLTDIEYPPGLLERKTTTIFH